jgi:hypothetical protein
MELGEFGDGGMAVSTHVEARLKAVEQGLQQTLGALAELTKGAAEAQAAQDAKLDALLAAVKLQGT